MLRNSLKKPLVLCFFMAFAILPLHSLANESSCFELGLTGNWMKITPSQNSYGVLSTDVDNIPNGTILDVKPKNRFGGGAYVYYTPCGEPYTWGISYVNYENKKTTRASGIIAEILVPPPISGEGYAGSATAFLNTRYHYGTVTISTEHAICSDLIYIRPHLGLGFLNEREIFNTTYHNPGSTILIAQNSKFNGMGPVGGADIRYSFCGDFSLFGNIEYAALLGRIKGDFSATSPTITRTIKFGGGNNSLVSQINSEIGLSYCFSFGCFDRATIALGWNFTKLFDVSKRLSFPDDVQIAYMTQTSTNTTLQGPFVRLAFKF